MKLSAEIKNGKFIYSYVIGESEHNHSMNLCADTLLLFSELIKMCHNSFKISTNNRALECQKKAVNMYEKCMEKQQGENDGIN